MGFRFRKSFKIIPGVRVNLTHRGVGMSVGGRRGRVSVNSRGRVTTTFGIPETGVSYTQSGQIGKRRRKKTKGRNTNSTTRVQREQNTNETMPPDYAGLGIFFKNIFAVLFIISGIVALFSSFFIGVICIIIGIVLWNVGQSRGTAPIVVQNGLENEINSTLHTIQNGEENNVVQTVTLHSGTDRENYEFMKQTFPEIAPKSFAGYMRMKNGRTENFMKLVDLAREKGINLL